jgi:thiamine kinase-like enzyme
VDVTVEAAIAAIPAWRGRVTEVTLLSGGLTNHNYLVRVDDTPYVVRIPGAQTDLLAIDRENELYNTRAAASVGIGPEVIHVLPALGVTVLGFIAGRTMSNQTLRGPEMPVRVAQALRTLHGGPRFLRDFDMFRLAEHYLSVVDERAIPVPAGYRELVVAVPRLERALARRPLPTVPCHNDLLAENYLDDGQRLRIVDYEYSGNNDPAFELGNTCQELGWDEGRVAALCAAYFGRASEPLLARLRLDMIMSDVGWTLWAAIQAKVSTIDYDFWGWALERWARAQAGLTSPDLGRWLTAVTKDPDAG